MARSPSLTSCASATSTSHSPQAGYHTPIDEGDPPPFTPRGDSLGHTRVPSPCSALMTVSLDAYLEPKRMSFSSPPGSELLPRAPSPDDSFPVFSPPPYETAAGGGASGSAQQRHAPPIGPHWMAGQLVTPRQSLSYSSRSPLSHHTCNQLVTLLIDGAFSVYTHRMKLYTLYLDFVYYNLWNFVLSHYFIPCIENILL